MGGEYELISEMARKEDRPTGTMVRILALEGARTRLAMVGRVISETGAPAELAE